MKIEMSDEEFKKFELFKKSEEIKNQNNLIKKTIKEIESYKDLIKIRRTQLKSYKEDLKTLKKKSV